MERFIYFFYLSFYNGLALLPLGLVYRLGAALGWLAHWLLPGYRRLVRHNLGIAFGNEKTQREIHRIACRHFSYLGANLLSSVKLATMPQEEVMKRVRVEGAEILEKIEGDNVGAVCVVSHMGNWEALAQVVPQLYSGKSATIFRPINNRYIDAHIRAARNRLGMELISRKAGFQRAVTLLGQRALVGVLVDQHAGAVGIWCPLFGRLASTSPLAATLAWHTGAHIFYAAIYTEGPGRWCLRAGEMNCSEAIRKDVGLLTAEINRVLEEQIRRSPEDWFWVHNRWKTPKPGFLLNHSKRGIVLPEGMAPAQLKPFRIVIRSSNWLGDAVISTPAVQVIKRGRPDAQVTVLTKAKLSDYWRRIPEVDTVLTIEPGEGVWGVARKLRRGAFDAAVVFPNSLRTALEPWLAGIPWRGGREGHWRRWLLVPIFWGRHARTKEVAQKQAAAHPRPAGHQVAHYMEIAEWLGGEVAPNYANAASYAPLISKNGAVAKAAGNGVIKIGLCPGAEYGPAKRWLPERFAQTANAVAERLSQKTGPDGQPLQCEWQLFGVQGDDTVGEQIVSQLAPLTPHINLIGKTTLAELMERLSECTCLLTNDTGTMHLAAALGVPVVALFGSTEPRLTAPLGSGHTVLRHQVECSPCFLRECPLDFRCMKALSVEEATRAVLAKVQAAAGVL